jgi:hypothetical protein
MGAVGHIRRPGDTAAAKTVTASVAGKKPQLAMPANG